MAQAIKDSFLDLEKHRQILEDNIAKLRKSLRHWQTWDAEYDGLKEEILSVDPTPNREELTKIARNYEAELVVGKEIEEILGTDQRTTAQVVNLLDRRIDYVQQNVKTIEKQIEAAEERLVKATIISTPEVRNEDGLPVTEIIEELDEEGNVISARTSIPGSVKPQLLEALQKAGMIEAMENTSKETSSIAENTSDEAVTEHGIVDATNLPSQTRESKQLNDTPKPKFSPKPIKKGVKFAEDTKPGPSEPKKEMSQAAKNLEAIMKSAKESEKLSSEPAIIPMDESAEDAALRREMLQYGMTEVGNVVAEINLEDGSDWESEDYADDSDSDEEEEDEFGRSRGQVVDNELRQKMIELEERLGVRMMENVGKTATDGYGQVQEGIGRISITGEEPKSAGKDIITKSSTVNAEDEPSVTSPTTEDSAKKSVRFAEELDISPALSTSLPAELETERKMAPIGDIVERKAPGQTALVPNPENKPSRFKTSRVPSKSSSTGVHGPASAHSSLKLFPATPSTPKPFSQPIFVPVEDTRRVPTGPENRTLAPQVVEREVALNTNAAPPDELDPQLLHQEVATEYHRMRNKIVGRQGGFSKQEEGEIVPFTEEEGGPRKMSRFKAARLAKS